MDRGKPLKRGTPLTRTTGLQAGTSRLARTGPLPRVSRRRAEQMATYRPLARAFLAAHPRCQFPEGCPRRSTEVHHRKGRAGERLLDQRYWAASCAPHNEFAETRTGEALILGWLLPIEGDQSDSSGDTGGPHR